MVGFDAAVHMGATQNGGLGLVVAVMVMVTVGITLYVTGRFYGEQVRCWTDLGIAGLVSAVGAVVMMMLAPEVFTALWARLCFVGVMALIAVVVAYRYQVDEEYRAAGKTPPGREKVI
jgi:hypothetical protein